MGKCNKSVYLHPHTISQILSSPAWIVVTTPSWYLKLGFSWTTYFSHDLAIHSPTPSAC